MTAKELERLERIATQLLAGVLANPDPQIARSGLRMLTTFALEGAQELIKQLDALKIPE